MKTHTKPDRKFARRHARLCYNQQYEHSKSLSGILFVSGNGGLCDQSARLLAEEITAAAPCDPGGFLLGFRAGGAATVFHLPAGGQYRADSRGRVSLPTRRMGKCLARSVLVHWRIYGTLSRAAGRFQQEKRRGAGTFQ